MECVIMFKRIISLLFVTEQSFLTRYAYPLEKEDLGDSDTQNIVSLLKPIDLVQFIILAHQLKYLRRLENRCPKFLTMYLI